MVRRLSTLQLGHGTELFAIRINIHNTLDANSDRSCILKGATVDGMWMMDQGQGVVVPGGGWSVGTAVLSLLGEKSGGDQ